MVSFCFKSLKVWSLLLAFMAFLGRETHAFEGVDSSLPPSPSFRSQAKILEKTKEGLEIVFYPAALKKEASQLEKKITGHIQRLTQGRNFFELETKGDSFFEDVFIFNQSLHIFLCEDKALQIKDKRYLSNIIEDLINSTLPEKIKSIYIIVLKEDIALKEVLKSKGFSEREEAISINKVFRNGDVKAEKHIVKMSTLYKDAALCNPQPSSSSSYTWLKEEREELEVSDSEDDTLLEDNDFFGIFIRDPQKDKIKGGIMGELLPDTPTTSFGYIDSFWVKGSLKQEGLGERLLYLAENYMKERGALFMYLDTFKYGGTFKEQNIFEKMGYISTFHTYKKLLSS